MKISRILSKATGMILILAVILSIAPVAAFAAENGPYADTSGHWAENAIAQWSDYGVLKGDNGSFRPDDPITRAEMAAVLDRVMKYQSTDSPVFTDVSPSAWYYDNVRHLAAAGVVTGVGGGSFAPDRNITRAEAAVMIARAFHIADGSGETAVFPDAADIADWAADAVQGLKDAGYINGFPDGGFHPKDTITRAEAATILDNMVGLLIDAAGEHDYAGLGEAVGIVVINTDGAAVKNLKVNGGLIVAAGVGAGETYLENVEVTGGVYVEGGGEDSVYFNNCTIRELVITKTRVHVALENGSVIEFALSLTGGNILEIGGSTAIGTLTIVGEGVTVLMTDNASVRTFNADAGDTVVEMAAGTGIVTANLNGQTTVSGSGTIREANIGVNGCEIEKKPETLRIQADITATVGGERVSAAPSPGGSTGGGWDTAPAFSSHSAPNKPNTPYGTAFFELSLPETVTLYATNGESCTAGVEWDESAYTPTQAGAQLITGTVAGTGLPAWAPSAISITVTVLEQPAAAVLVIKGETDQAEPPTEIIKGSSKLYTDLIEDRDGTKMTGQTVTWRIEPEVAGVHVTENGGVVTVDADCTATAFTLRALCGEATAVHTVEIKAPTAEKAPQVTDLTLLSLEHSGENTSLGYDLYVNWMTPDALPYPVRYLFEIVDDQGNVMGGIGSYEQDPADPRNLGLLWNWNIMDIIPPESGSYRLRVITQAVHDPALNSDPVYGSQTLDVTYTMDERPRFSHLAYLGTEGDMMRFGPVLEDGVAPLKEDEHYYIAFDYGTGWMDHFVERPSSWGPDALEIRITVDPARGGGNVAAERCSARVYRFYPIIFSGDTVSITLSRALDLHVMVN